MVSFCARVLHLNCITSTREYRNAFFEVLHLFNC